MQSDYNGCLIRRIDLLTSAVSTIAGTAGTTGTANGVGLMASFRNPSSVAINSAGTFALVVGLFVTALSIQCIHASNVFYRRTPSIA